MRLIVVLFIIMSSTGHSQIAQHIHVDNDPVQWSGVATFIALLFVPLLILTLGLIWKVQKKLYFKVTGCGTTPIFKKEIKHLTNDGNLVKNRDIIYRRDVFDN